MSFLSQTTVQGVQDDCSFFGVQQFQPSTVRPRISRQARLATSHRCSPRYLFPTTHPLGNVSQSSLLKPLRFRSSNPPARLILLSDGPAPDTDAPHYGSPEGAVAYRGQSANMPIGTHKAPSTAAPAAAAAPAAQYRTSMGFILHLTKPLFRQPAQFRQTLSSGCHCRSSASHSPKDATTAKGMPDQCRNETSAPDTGQLREWSSSCV